MRGSSENPLRRMGGALRRGGFPDQQPTPGCRLRPPNPPEVPLVQGGTLSNVAPQPGMKNSSEFNS